MSEPASLRRVLIVGQFFPPSNESMALYMGDIAAALADEGVEVYAIAEQERQPYHGSAHLLPVPAPFRGQRRLWSRGIKSLAFAAAAAWHVWRYARSDSAVLVVSMPPFAAFAAYPAARLRGATFAWLEYDIYPEIVRAVAKIPAPLYAIWRWCRDLLRRRVDVIIVPSQGMASRIVSDTPRAAPVEVIPNWADEQIRPLLRHENPLVEELEIAPDELVVLYSGTVGHAHVRPLATLIEAAALLRDERIRWVIIGGGGGRPAIERMVQERGLDRVLLLDRQPMDRVPFTLTLGDIAVISVDEEASDLLAPSKLYGYQAAGLPVLNICARRSDLDAETVDTGAGWRIAPGDVDGLVALLGDLRRDPSSLERAGAASRQQYERFSGRARGVGRYIEVLRAAAHRRLGRRDSN